MSHLSAWQKAARDEYVKQLGLAPYPTEEFEALIDKIARSANQGLPPVTVKFNNSTVEVTPQALYAADRMLAEAQGNFLLYKRLCERIDRHVAEYMRNVAHAAVEREAYLIWKGSDEVLSAAEAWACAEHVLKERAKQEFVSRFAFFEYANELT